MAQISNRRWWSSTWPFAGLCMLVSGRWLVEGAHPEMASTHLTQAAGCMLAGMAVWISLSVRPTGTRLPESKSERSRSQTTIYATWPLCVAGAATLSGAALTATVSDWHVNGEAATLSLALTPVVVAVASAVIGEGEEGDLQARLWPGLAGVAGLLLLLPQPSLSNWRVDAALLLMPLVAGIAAASVTGRLVFHQQEEGAAVRKDYWKAESFGLAALVFSGLALRGFSQGMDFKFSFEAAVLDGLTAWLSLTVLADLGAVRWSAQFLIIPLLTLLQGVVLLRPILDLRSWAAFFLLSISGGYLLVTGSVRSGRSTVSLKENVNA